MYFIKIFFIFIFVQLVLCNNYYTYLKYYNDSSCNGQYEKIERIPCNVPLINDIKNIVLCGYKNNFIFIVYSNFTKFDEFDGCRSFENIYIKSDIIIENNRSNEIIFVIFIILICCLSAYTFAFTKKTIKTMGMSKTQIVNEMIKDISSYAHIFRSADNIEKTNNKEIFV